MFSAFSFVCFAVIFALIVKGVCSIRDFLSFDAPGAMMLILACSTAGLLAFGILLTVATPSRHIDDTN